jgi:hypothetical protein
MGLRSCTVHLNTCSVLRARYTCSCAARCFETVVQKSKFCFAGVENKHENIDGL